MVRPATLDRVENGGSGSDINPRERKSKGTKLDKPSTLPARDLQSAAVLEAVKARPGNVGVCFYGRATAGLDSLEHGGVRNLRSGRKKACGAVEQKKGAETRKQERKRLRLWRRLENEGTGLTARTKELHRSGESDDIVPFSCRGLREDETRWRTGLPSACEPW